MKSQNNTIVKMDNAKRWMRNLKISLFIILIILGMDTILLLVFQLSNYTGPLIVIPLAICVIILICCYPISRGRYKSAMVELDDSKKQYEILARTKHFDENTKSRLIALIKGKNELNISSVAKILSISVEQIRMLIYELSGEMKIDGEFIDDDTFKINSSVEDFLDALDKQFVDWASKERSKLGKKI